MTYYKFSQTLATLALLLGVLATTPHAQHQPSPSVTIRPASIGQLLTRPCSAGPSSTNLRLPCLRNLASQEVPRVPYSGSGGNCCPGPADCCIPPDYFIQLREIFEKALRGVPPEPPPDPVRLGLFIPKVKGTLTLNQLGILILSPNNEVLFRTNMLCSICGKKQSYKPLNQEAGLLFTLDDQAAKAARPFFKPENKIGVIFSTGQPSFSKTLFFVDAASVLPAK